MPTFTRWHTEIAEKIASGIPLEQRIPVRGFHADVIQPAPAIEAGRDEVQPLTPEQVRELWEV